MKKIKKLMSSMTVIAIIISALSVPAMAAEAPSAYEGIKVVNLETGDVLDIVDYSVEIKEQGNNSVIKTVTANISLGNPDTRSTVIGTGDTIKITCNTTATQSGSNWRITRFDATYEILDPAFVISNRHIKVANYGPEQVQQNTVNNYIYDYYPTTNTFSKSYSNMPWVGSVGAPAYVGGYAECQISRGGSSWSLQCRDLIIESSLL